MILGRKLCLICALISLGAGKSPPKVPDDNKRDVSFIKDVTDICLYKNINKIRTGATPKVTESSKRACNGSSSLCGKTYDSVTYVTAHNGGANIPSKTLNLYTALQCLKSNINDQDLELMDQFNMGVRAIKGPLLNRYYVGKGSSPFTCHGLSPADAEKAKKSICGSFDLCGVIFQSIVDPCLLDSAVQPLSDLVSAIGNFLDKNPNEVMTLFLEDQTDAPFDWIYNAINGSSAKKYVYVHSYGSAWPTLGTMIDKGKRLVIFLDSPRFADSAKKTPQYFNKRSDYVWSTGFDYADDGAIINDPAPQKQPRGMMWRIQHFVTPGLAGNRSYSAKVNNLQVIQNRVNKYKTDKNPTFIWIDFIEYSNDSLDIFNYADQLNGISYY